ncbi:ATP-binding protein [Enterococcus cecorum]|uniref:ATP-binding protein n=1 Tax=Enterococcus cecorum TaxID=44008 RepID=UPI0032C3EA19
MTILKLKNVNFKDFKGITHFEFEIQERNAVVAGQNGTGKTSLLDGWLWLLLGKDSRGSKLNPKPLDELNQEKLGLEPMIEATVIIDGKEVKLKRIQEEKWTTPKGQLEKVRGSDTTKYYIDDVPVKEKDFKAFIEKYFNDELLQILSDSTYFMSMNWKKRREYLMKLSTLTDDEIIEKIGGKTLIELLDGKSVDERMKMLVASKRELNRNIEGLPGRIQENADMKERILATLNELSLDDLTLKKSTLLDELAKAENTLLNAQSGDASLDFQQEKFNLEMKLAELKNSYMTNQMAKTREYDHHLSELTSNKRILMNAISEKEWEVEKRLNLIDGIKNEIDSLRKSYVETNKTTFDEHLTVCPTCKQKLPDEDIETLIGNFNNDKSNKLEYMKERAESLKQALLNHTAEKQNYENDINKLKDDLDEVTNKIAFAEEEKKNLESNLTKLEDTTQYQKIMNDIELCNQKIEDAKNDSGSMINEFKNKVNEIKSELQEVNNQIARFADLAKYDERIAELREQDKQYKQTYAEIEKSIYMLEDFTRKKVKMLEDSINDKFKLVKFKLFNQLKNGGIDECCEATYKGVEYSSSLNTGARINCDLDIINTLSNELGIKVPLFIDNTESVTDLALPATQTIELKVAENKKLEVEYYEQ